MDSDMYTPDMELIARAIGWYILSCFRKEEAIQTLRADLQGEPLRVVEQIKCILDDESLDDPTCFQRIDRIVEAFHAYGIQSSRHDF